MKPIYSISLILILILFMLILNDINQHIQIYKSFNGKTYLMKNKKYDNIIHKRSFFYEYSNLNTLFDPYSNAINILNEMTRCEDISKRTIEIIEVESSCGPGCGILGGNTIEIEELRFDQIVNSSNIGEVDHLIFYELGRSYWLYSNKLNYPGCEINHTFHTGYAIFIRTILMLKLSKHFNFAPINEIDFEDYVENLDSLYDDFLEATKSVEYVLFGSYESQNLLKAGPAKVFASILFHLYSKYNDKIFIDLWCETYYLKDAKSCDDIFDNFFIASCIATESDLTDWFLNDIKWPISDKYHNFYCTTKK